MVLNPLKIQEKNSKKIFLPVYPGTKSPLLRGENLFKKYLAASCIGYYLRFFIFFSKVVTELTAAKKRYLVVKKNVF